MPSGCHASELNLEIKMYNDLYVKKKNKKKKTLKRMVSFNEVRVT